MSLTSLVSSLFSTIYADAPSEEPKVEETPEASEEKATEEAVEEEAAEEEAAEEEEPEPEDVSMPLMSDISSGARRGVLTDVYREVASTDSRGMPERCSVCPPYEALSALPGEGQ